MPQTLADGGVLLDMFPFDSNPNNITTVNGYLKGDRSVDAWTMRGAFKQFFSNGVFGTPASAFRISKADSGMNVIIQPGMAIIEGAMGGIEERNGSIQLTLDTVAEGNLCYGIFLRFDDNSDVRGVKLYSKKGEASETPQPPTPDTTSKNVYELRLGYVTVPNGSTDLSDATVTNEKGLAVCPYAAPFEEIDVSEVVSDMTESGIKALQKLLDYFETYKDAIDAALSDEEATYLQQQINNLSQQISDVNLSEAVDDITIEYSTDLPDDIENKLRVKDGGITGDKIADYAIDSNKFTADLQIKLDVVDTSNWGFEQYYGFVGSLSGDDQTDFVNQMDAAILNTWSQTEKVKFVQVLNSNSQKTLMAKVDLVNTSWPDLQAMSDACSSTGRSGMLGRSKSETWNGSAHDFLCVSIDHYSGVNGLIFMYRDPSNNNTVPNRSLYTGSYQVAWENTSLRSYTNTTWLNLLDAEMRNILKECPIPTHNARVGNNAPVATTVMTKAWTPSPPELTTSLSGVPTYMQEGSIYDWFAQGNDPGLRTIFWTRTVDAHPDNSVTTTNYAYISNSTGGGYSWKNVGANHQYATAIFVCV